ncbi:Alpha-L-rhamnosidase like protein [Verticillium longisporum]|uniref:Alpha-L-rhamnosidase like protein n=1 Tax=Verticillium longisporum TaxID=100787 RepID=A0A8I2ZBT7_VERLO|nr:Alpha-L-rhamnosidase like protein [Verticillium longisporum]
MIPTQDYPESDETCPGDRQTAYEIQAAATADDLRAGRFIWKSGKTEGNEQNARFGISLTSRDTVAWRVKVWDALGQPSGWSRPQPLPLFVRHSDIPSGKVVADARLYISGVGMHHATVNGEDATDEVLAPGYSNYQLSSEYRTYDATNALRSGPNAVGVSLGNGPAYVRRNVRNPAVGRNAPYSWWESQLMGNSTLSANVTTGSSNVRLSSVARYNIGGSINIDTGDGGDRLESRVITAIDNGTSVTGSGNNIAASDPSAGAAVTPRFIARLEIMFDNGSSTIIVTDRSWRTALGPLVTDAWYSGSGYDTRREQLGWDKPGTDLKSSTWTSAGIAPPPNLATKLVARAAKLIREQERFSPVSVTNPAPGIWVFDFGQNIVGWPLITLPELPAGVTIKVAPAEGLNANGTVTGLPSGFEPGPELVTGIRLQADVPIAGTLTSSNARLNRIIKMAHYSFASNLMSVFTDCPGREKLSYPADYTMLIGAIYRNFHVDGMLRTSMHHLVEGQFVADTPMAGNVALKTPVYDWGYSGRFGDEINWGNAIVFVPSFLHDLYGDTTVMSAYYDQMTDFVNYIQREKVQDHIVDAALADWVENDGRTSGRITGTWGYYHTIQAMAHMADLINHTEDAVRYASLAVDIRDAFNNAFFNKARGRYTSRGNDSTVNATPAAQALDLDAGLVPSEHRETVLEALVELVESYPSADGEGPHLSGGTIGLGPIVRALSAGGRDDVLWAALQKNDRPSYGYFMAPTTENPDGFTTIGERWTRSDSKNHMILAQIDEWFHAGVAGIQAGSLGTISATWADKLVFQPEPVGDLTSATGTFRRRAGEARSEWTRAGDAFALSVTVPANTEAEVRVAGEKHTKGVNVGVLSF